MYVIQDGHPQWVTQEVPSAPAMLQAQSTSPDAAAAATLSRIFELSIAGPFRADLGTTITSIFPEGTALDGVEVTSGAVTVRLTLPAEIIERGLSDEELEAAAQMTSSLWDFVPGLTSVSIVARASAQDEYQPFSSFYKPAPKLTKPEEAASMRAPGQSVAPGQPQPAGALSGASVFLSPGHGWYYSTTLGRWATQRGNSYNIIEDLSNSEAVCQYLCQYLWNAGARVYVVRERDLNTNMVVVDAGGAGHTQSGSWTNETVSGAYNGSHRYASTVTGSATATSTFTPAIPEAGHYSVWVWYRKSAAGTTAADARITIKHSGGSTTWVQDQNRDGYTWKYAGTYYFEAGSNPAAGSVVIDNKSATAGHRVIADAVRFGGGMGSVRDPDSNTVSGKPRFEESGLYYAGFMGKSDWASFGTVSAMPNYAEWECESWEQPNSIYVSWHTNANDGTARGTSSYAYASGGWDTAFNGVAGGDILRNTIQSELMNDIRAGWDANWRNAGNHTNWYGELNPSNNNKMPAAITEIAFHDNSTDAAALRDPDFRRLAARAVYQAIAKYYRNNVSGFSISTLLPEPPTNVRLTASGTGSVNIAWNAPPYNTGNGLLGDAATGYKVYRSTNGKGFDNGTAVTGTSTLLSNLTPGQLYYFRVSATNAGGESFPTETLAVRVPSSGTPQVLVVNGFDRIDSAMNVVEDDPHSASPLQRGYLWRMNSYDYIIPHAKAVSAAGKDFDSCSNEAVIASQVDLANYASVIWILGRESSADKSFDATEQAKVSAFLNGGGNLFVSGSEVGYELDNLNVARSFYNNTLRADYVADTSGAYSASGAAGSIFSGIALSIDNGSSLYYVDSADVINPVNGSLAALTYGAASSTVASFDGIGGWKDPNYSGSTNAAPDSTFSIASSPVRQGSGSGDLYYVWEATSTLIREYNSELTEFPTNSSFSIWVYGDNSGHRVRISLRDPVDGELFANPYLTIDFTGWRQISWPNIQTNQGTKWAGTGDGVLSGATVQFESIQVSKVSSQMTGHLYFDDATWAGSGDSGTAAIQYSGAYKLLSLAFPFEAILEESARNAVMNAAFSFFAPASQVQDWSLY